MHGPEDDELPTIGYQAIDIYRELIDEKVGVPARDEKKRMEMKAFMKNRFHTEDIEMV